MTAAPDPLDPPLGRIVFGAMTFGTQVDEAEAAEMIAVCREAGITMFDTSNNYGGGASEEILGRLVKPFRDEVHIATKGGSHVDQDDPEMSGLTRTAIVRSVDASLRRLGTDHIDVWYFHRPDWRTPIEESLAAAEEVVAAGKVGQIAQSNFAAWQITEMHWLAEREGWPRPVMSQQMYNLLGRRVEAEYEACARRLGLTTIVYNPLAGGMLTGKHRRDDQPSAGRFVKPLYRERYWNDAQFDAVDRLSGIADQAGLTLIELAFRWVLARPLTGAMLLGASSLGQLRANLAAIDGPAPDADTMAACDAVWADLRGAAPDYNR